MAAAFEGLVAPTSGTPVYKEECALCFSTAESMGGLFICMKTFQSYCKDCLELYTLRTNNRAFLQMVTTKKKIEADPASEPVQKKPTKLAIGVEGGFDVNAPKYEYTNAYSVVEMPGYKRFKLDSPDLPQGAKVTADAIVAAETASMVNEAAAWEEQRKVSKHADNLVQLDNGVKVPPSGFKCEKCDITDNVWLNLSDGSILCGRRFFDGSGGNNHAIDHFEETGKQYPLAVKLGTITADGADVYSYEEDDMVVDPHLSKHLKHFGINVLEQVKTVKTMAEMEIQANMELQFEQGAILEAGVKLVPKYGPGFTGLRNLGNSCYMNSVMQVLFSLEQFTSEFGNSASDIFATTQVDRPTEDFYLQLCKLGHGLLSGRYSEPPKEGEDEDKEACIVPKMFKQVAGKGHPEFSGPGQQDASEYLSHVCELMTRSARKYGHGDPTKQFQFEMETRVQCNSSQKVKYMDRTETSLGVAIDLSLAENAEEVAAYNDRKTAAETAGTKFEEPVVRPQVALTKLLTFDPEVVDNWYSSAIKAKTSCTRLTLFKSFPKYLVLRMNRFSLAADWTPVKLDVSLEIPDELDLTKFKSTGLQDGEEELPEGEAEPAPAVEIDEGMVTQLASMGFDVEGCKKAVFNNPTSIEAAMEWVMAHMGDPDFTAPFQAPGAAPAAGADDADAPSEESIMMLSSMGFTPDQAKFALKQTSNNLERAADWLFNHAGDVDSLMAADAASASTAAAPQEPSSAGSGSGKYRLKAFISHIGRTAHSGHYVCHVNKEGTWYLFNDGRVAVSQKPPITMGYVYFFESI
eukprot:m.9051 g.9051  ORF g.9051 m.9051 type:complete len:803 (+) comp5418_c0_seq1:192-2600(+)